MSWRCALLDVRHAAHRHVGHRVPITYLTAALPKRGPWGLRIQGAHRTCAEGDGSMTTSAQAAPTTSMPAPTGDPTAIKHGLIERYQQVRRFTEQLCEPLVTEDYVIQSMPDVSPTKWHIAHVSWFFETFLL